MSKKFFIRFNLHKSASEYPINEEIFKPFVNEDINWIKDCLNDIEDVQNKRAEDLKAKFPKEISKIKGKKVAFLGDSITSDNLGYRMAVTKAAQLQAFDRSISGATSALMLHPAYLVQKEKPDIVSIMIGVNDSKCLGDKTFAGVPLCAYERNLRAMVRWSTENGAKVILMGVTPIIEEQYDKSFNPRGTFGSNDMVREYNAVVKKIASDFEVKYLDNDWINEYDEVSELFEPDGAHLSVKGHDILAEKWIKAVAEIV
ncbi:MAG: hypothetical protein J6D26_06465 [Clostridia bacterium]|nr:hypothetical protein [Clostridia bacterium]